MYKSLYWFFFFNTLKWVIMLKFSVYCWFQDLQKLVLWAINIAQENPSLKGDLPFCSHINGKFMSKKILNFKWLYLISLHWDGTLWKLLVHILPPSAVISKVCFLKSAYCIGMIYLTFVSTKQPCKFWTVVKQMCLCYPVSSTIFKM